MIRSVAALLAVLLGCAPPGEPADTLTPGAAVPDGSAAGNELVGVVRVVGSAPMNTQIVLQPEEGGAVRLVGSLADELEQLAGATVAVEGPVGPSPDPLVDRELTAVGYRIVEVNGRAAVVGEVVSTENGNARLRTAEGDEVYLTGVPESFRVGQKVWVQGPRSLTVQSYGLIRE
jgi:hypothetical protein